LFPEKVRHLIRMMQAKAGIDEGEDVFANNFAEAITVSTTTAFGEVCDWSKARAVSDTPTFFHPCAMSAAEGTKAPLSTQVVATYLPVIASRHRLRKLRYSYPLFYSGLHDANHRLPDGRSS
jgi:hypothetical protein